MSSKAEDLANAGFVTHAEGEDVLNSSPSRAHIGNGGDSSSDAKPPDGTLGARICMLVDRHGSLRNVGKILSIDHAYLKRLRDGDKVNPSETVLKKLGLKRIVTYRLRSVP